MLFRIKKLLFQILPTGWFLKSMQFGFFTLFEIGFLKKDPRFKFHYAVKKLISNQDVVLDIGANLGYFSVLFAKSNPKGKLYSIEPIPIFYKELSNKLRHFRQARVLNAAIGDKSGHLSMVMPHQKGVIRTGLPHVISENEIELYENVIQVPVIDANSFLKDFSKLDFIKCDIEGYEWIVFSAIKNEINRLRPIIQIEISESHLTDFIQYFKDVNYIQAGLYDGRLIEENGKQKETSDFLFIPIEKKDAIFYTFNVQ